MNAEPAQALTSSEAVLWMIERDPVLRSTDRRRRRARRAARHGPAAAPHGPARPRRSPGSRRRVVPDGAGVPHWVDGARPVTSTITSPDVRLPAPGRCASSSTWPASRPARPSTLARPLWHLTVVDGMDGGRAALVVKVHHAVTDGVGGVGLLPIFTDLEASPADGDRGCRPGGSAAARQAQRGNAPASLSGSRAPMLGEAASDPVGALTFGPRIAQLDGQAPRSGDARSHSDVMTERGLDRHLDTLDVSLRSLARAGKAVGGTVNDAFLAAVVGGLRSLPRRHGSRQASCG